MKIKSKVLLVFVLLISVFTLSGCGGEDNTPSTSDDNSSNTTTTETTTTATTTAATESKIWEKKFYVDDFEQPTDEWYIINSTIFTGKFSNSATTDSTLYAYILVDAKDVSIMLYEYGRNQVKNASSRYDEDYDITMLLDDNSRVDVKGAIYPGNDRITITSGTKQKVIDALKNNKKVVFKIVESDRTVTSYLFEAHTANFNDIYSN